MSQKDKQIFTSGRIPVDKSKRSNDQGESKLLREILSKIDRQSSTVQNLYTQAGNFRALDNQDGGLTDLTQWAEKYPTDTNMQKHVKSLARAPRSDMDMALGMKFFNSMLKGNKKFAQLISDGTLSMDQAKALLLEDDLGSFMSKVASAIPYVKDIIPILTDAWHTIRSPVPEGRITKHMKSLGETQDATNGRYLAAVYCPELFAERMPGFSQKTGLFIKTYVLPVNTLTTGNTQVSIYPQAITSPGTGDPNGPGMLVITGCEPIGLTGGAGLSYAGPAFPCIGDMGAWKIIGSSTYFEPVLNLNQATGTVESSYFSALPNNSAAANSLQMRLSRAEMRAGLFYRCRALGTCTEDHIQRISKPLDSLLDLAFSGNQNSNIPTDVTVYTVIGAPIGVQVGNIFWSVVAEFLPTTAGMPTCGPQIGVRGVGTIPAMNELDAAYMELHALSKEGAASLANEVSECTSFTQTIQIGQRHWDTFDKGQFKVT